MSLTAFQHALVELTLAPRRTRQLLRGDLSAIAEYDLTDRERARLLDVVRQPGMALNCTIARSNRFEAIGEVFPMTCVLLEPILRDLLDELWEDSKPGDYQFTGEENAFASLIRSKRAAGGLPIEYLDEVLAYEWLCWELAQHMRTQSDPNVEVEAVIEFRHSPDQLLVPLSRLEAPPPGLAAGEYRAKVTLRGGRFDVELIEKEFIALKRNHSASW